MGDLSDMAEMAMEREQQSRDEFLEDLGFWKAGYEKLSDGALAELTKSVVGHKEYNFTKITGTVKGILEWYGRRGIFSERQREVLIHHCAYFEAELSRIYG